MDQRPIADGEVDLHEPASPRDRGLRDKLALALVLLATALAYSSSLSGEAVWDDRSLVVNRLETREFQGFAHYFREPFWQRQDRPETFYRPLVSLSLALDHAVWRGSPAGFHATNLLLHLCVCALVFCLARRAGAGVAAAALAATLFGTLPRLSESVAWISGRSDVLAAAAGLAAIWLYVRRPPSPSTRVAAAAALLLALFSKENGIAALAAIMAFEAYRVRHGRTSPRTALTHMSPCVCALLGYAALRVSAVQDVGGAATLFPLATRVAMPFDVMGALVQMTLDPLHPSPRIGRAGVIEPLRVVLGGVGFAGLAMALWQAFARSRSAVVCAVVVFAVVPLLPVLQILPPFSDVTAADRFLYLPAAGLAVAIAAWTTALAPNRRKLVACAALAAIPLFAWALGDAIETWADERILWDKTLVRASPYDALPHSALGNWYAEHDAPEQALDHYERALDAQARYARIYPAAPADPELLGAVGITSSVLGRYHEAVTQLERRAALYPARADSHLLLGVAYARSFDFDRARESLQRAHEMGAPQARELIAQTRRARELLNELDASSATGSDALTLRARACALVGRLREAEDLYARLPGEPRASDAQLAQAAHFLVLRGDPARAREALEALAGRERVDPKQVAALELQLSQRR